jgi:hypothetical protein
MTNGAWICALAARNETGTTWCARKYASPAETARMMGSASAVPADVAERLSALESEMTAAKESFAEMVAEINKLKAANKALRERVERLEPEDAANDSALPFYRAIRR